LWTGVVFFRHWRLTSARGAAMLTVVFALWGLHHLDYPLLRARGAWNPWGYYLDILFVLATSIGIVMLVLEEMDRDLRAMLALAGERLPRGNVAHMDHLVQRLNSSLLARTQELEQLSDRIVQQHESMRRSVSRELHDQSAQVWAAVRLQLGGLREEVPADLAPRIDRLLSLVDDGMRSIRTVTEHLRPPVLDDLGALPALRALIRSFAEQSGLDISFSAPDMLPPISSEGSLALYRAVQEALANVIRHSGATRVTVTLQVANDALTVNVRDNGRGITAPHDGSERSGFGIAGIRERLAALHGSLTVTSGDGGGASLTMELPLVPNE
jgi:signal transduction histidine kinase